VDATEETVTRGDDTTARRARRPGPRLILALSAVVHVSVHDSDPTRARLLGAAVLAGVPTAVASVGLAWSRLVLTNRPVGGGDLTVLVGAVTGVIGATVASVPFLLAVLFVVTRPTRRSLLAGALLVYVGDVLTAVGQRLLTGVQTGVDLTVLVVPLTRVVALFAIATATWLAYHGGYERLVAATGDATQHPLFAVVADERVGPALSLQRALVAAGVAALVGAGGLVAVGAVGSLVDALTRSVTGGSGVVVGSRAWVRDVGISLPRLPRRWLFEASFLLAVLFVTGPRLRGRDLLKGLAVVFGVQSTVFLLPMLRPPFRPVYLFGAPGPILTPLTDASLLVGVAVAVWLGGHGGLARLGQATGVGSLAE
jgi:hypothetical protein